MAGVVEDDLNPLRIKIREGAVLGAGFTLAGASEQSMRLGVWAVSPSLCSVLFPVLTGATVGAGWGDGHGLTVAS